MSITVNTNLSSMIAQRSLYKATNKMNTALERLSTGARINSSKDDASGSAISTKLGYKISSYNVAKDNAQMGQSMLETANGSLSQINSMLQRIRDLSEQASNGTYGMDERKAMQAEIDGLTEEIYRIKNTTEFNGKKIFGETFSYEEKQTKEVQSATPTMSMTDVSEATWDSTKNQVIGISSTQELKKMADLINSGKESSNRTFALTADIDLNELGDLDGNGSNWNSIDDFSGTFDGNGHTISNLKCYNSNWCNGLFSSTDGATIKNINLSDFYMEFDTPSKGSLIGIAMNTTVENIAVKNSSIKLTDANYVPEVGVGGLIGQAYISTINNCYVIDSDIYSVDEDIDNGGIVGYSEGNTLKNCYSNCAVEGGMNQGALVGGSWGDTFIDCAYDPVKSGQYEPVCGDYPPGIFDDDSNPVVIPPATTTITITTTKNAYMSCNTNLQVGVNSDSSSTIAVDTGVDFGDFKVSVLEENDARESLSKIDEMMDKVTAKMTEIGSAQNRLESTMEFQDVQISALTSANSLIKDADIAEESSNYIKNQILQNVTSSLLATANQNPSIALQLL